jgi:hypothetical protein
MSPFVPFAGAASRLGRSYCKRQEKRQEGEVKLFSLEFDPLLAKSASASFVGVDASRRQSLEPNLGRIYGNREI